jgi:hypothetical protein
MIVLPGVEIEAENTKPNLSFKRNEVFALRHGIPHNWTSRNFCNLLK